MRDEWNQIYINGQELNKYPSEILVSWVYQNKIKKNIRCLDIGCGFGNNLRFLLTYGLDVYGIDNSDFIINLLTDEFEQRVSCQNIQSTNFKSNTFDLLIDRQSIQHNNNEDLSDIFNECYRLLKNGGQFFHNFLLTDGNGSTKASLNETELEKILNKLFFIKEKNYCKMTSSNATLEHISIIYTLLKNK